MKTIKDQGRKQVGAIESLKPEENQQDLKSIEVIFSKEMRTSEIKNELDEIKNCEENI